MPPLAHVIEVTLLMLGAYLGGCVLGYFSHLAWRHFTTRPRLETAPLSVPSSAPQRSAARRLARAVERDEPANPEPSTPTQQRPPELPAPRGGKADDLRKIKGIGPKTESALNDLGIYHHDQIAAWTPANIDWLEGRIAVRGRIRREQWVEQAVLLVTAPV